MQKRHGGCYTGVAGAATSDCNRLIFDADGCCKLTLAVVGDVVCAADRFLVAAVTDRLQTLSQVQVMAHSAFQVLSTSTVQPI